MSKKEIVIINNEKISIVENNFYCDNIDIQTIPQDLSKNCEVTLIARNSKVKRERSINLSNIKVSSNILTFLINIFKTFKKKKSIYLIISVTPYTFFSYILLFFWRKKIYLYLRSNGYEEYKEVLGFIGPVLYYVMFKLISIGSIIIVCQKKLFKKNNNNLVFPSELTSIWLENFKKPNLDKPRLLYIGRMKVEKGIFSFIKMFEEMSPKISLSIVGREENKKINNKRVHHIGSGFEASDLIKIYDEHNIFILPSFTEAHPKVVDESLARLRPVIVFEEIHHIVQNNKEGIFVAKRNIESLTKTIHFIMKNYLKIQERMKKNKLPTKKEFINQMINILNLGR